MINIMIFVLKLDLYAIDIKITTRYPQMKI